MSETDNSGSAFPISRPDWYEAGMTLRDYFAGQSIMGCCPGSGMSDNEVTQYARLAYRLADAMIAAREAK